MNAMHQHMLSQAKRVRWSVLQQERQQGTGRGPQSVPAGRDTSQPVTSFRYYNSTGLLLAWKCSPSCQLLRSQPSLDKFSYDTAT